MANNKNNLIVRIDPKTVAPLQQKREIAFINHFLLTNLEFLNAFFAKCEKQLMQFEEKFLKVEATLIILEKRLSSINNFSKVDSSLSNQIKSSSNEDPSNLLENANEEIASIADQLSSEYEKFLKMFHVGVPLDAVKIKISLEGLNPDVFQSYLDKKKT